MDRDVSDASEPHAGPTGNDAVPLLIGIVVLLAIMATASLSLDYCLARL